MAQKFKYKSRVYGKTYMVELEEQVRWECPKCGMWLLEKFEKPFRCGATDCDYIGDES